MTTIEEQPAHPRRARLAAALAAAVLVASALSVSLSGGAGAVNTLPAVQRPMAPAPVVHLAAFPVQGPCSFIGTFGAPRSGGRTHEGTDIIAESGRMVYAVSDGTLSKQTNDRPGSLSGNAWWLHGNDGNSYFYAHLAAFAPGLKVGSKVSAGQVIGYVGSTGNAGTSHTHFEIHPKGGAAIDSYPSLAAVDGCKTSTPPSQPGGTLPAPPVTVPPVPQSPSKPANLPTNNGTLGGARWQFVPPSRVFTTSWIGGRLTPHRTQAIDVSKTHGLSQSSPGLLLRLMTHNAVADGWLVAHPCDGALPLAASLTYSTRTSATAAAFVNMVEGSVCITSNTAVGVTVDVIAVQSPTGVGLQPFVAKRALDTRETGVLRAGTTQRIDPEALGYTPGTQALSATFTIVDPTGSGTLHLSMCGGGAWDVPFGKDGVASFSMSVRASPAGWCLTSSATVHVVVDITGRWAGSDGPGVWKNTRVYDSREEGGPVTSKGVSFKVAGANGLPAGISSVIVAVTAVTGGNDAVLFAMPCGTGRADGAVMAGIPNRISTVVVPAGLSGGNLCMSAMFPIDVVVDVIAIN